MDEQKACDDVPVKAPTRVVETITLEALEEIRDDFESKGVTILGVTIYARRAATPYPRKPSRFAAAPRAKERVGVLVTKRCATFDEATRAVGEFIRDGWVVLRVDVKHPKSAEPVDEAA